MVSRSGERQRVVVTAGASGIGREVVARFLESGARVHVGDADQQALERLRMECPDVGSTRVDVSQEEQVEQLFDDAVGSLGGLDVLVAGAGIAGPTAPVESLALEDWRRCVSVNLDGGFLCVRLAAPPMKSQRSGSVVLISSAAGLHGYPLRTPYAAAKWGVIGLAKSLAMELGPFGIRVNAVCPGSVEGARMDGVIAREAAAKGESQESIRARYTAGVSLRTFVTARDIAETVHFLCSPAGARISGQAVAVDGHTENPGTLEK